MPSMSSSNVVIVHAVRTPIGRRGGGLSTMHPADVLGVALKELIARSGIDPAEVEQVVGGCVSQVGEQSFNITRTAWLAAGLPQATAATTVDTQCGSSQQATSLAASLIGSGAIDVAIACGVEVMSRVPIGSNSNKNLGLGVPIPKTYFGQYEFTSQFEGAERAGSGQEGLATYGSVPLFAGTFLISAIALTVAVPVGLMAAIYLSEYASPRIRATVKPLMEILAGIPTVVYGFFAALTVAPLVRGAGESIGLTVASESALAAGLVMGIMIIPFVSSLSDDVINAVPQSLRDAALGLGSTRSEMTKQVVLPAALPGIVASVLLAVSRAVGETMIVVMAAGLAANLSANPLDAVTTVTAQIVTILVGDQEFESAKTLSAFALALTLIVITLVLNLIALQIVKKYREQYD